MTDQSTEARLREAAEAWWLVHEGMQRFGMESDDIDTLNEFFSRALSLPVQDTSDELTRLRAEVGPSPTASEVLAYLDYFAGQENTPDEVCDFVQKAARFIDQRKTVDEWRAEPEMDQFVDWCIEQRTLNK